MQVAKDYHGQSKTCFENVVPGEMEIEDSAFVDDLNFLTRLPVVESIWQTMPSTPAV